MRFVDGGDCVFGREGHVGDLVLVGIEAVRGSESAFRCVRWERALKVARREQALLWLCGAVDGLLVGMVAKRREGI